MQLELRPLAKCWIYAFLESRRIIYVGQTRDLYREQRHRKRQEFAEARFKILRECLPDHASRLEKQITRACQRRGQAQFNKGLYGYHGLTPTHSRAVLIDGLRYESLAAGARALAVSTATLKNYARQGNARIKMLA